MPSSTIVLPTVLPRENETTTNDEPTVAATIDATPAPEAKADRRAADPAATAPPTDRPAATEGGATTDGGGTAPDPKAKGDDGGGEARGDAAPGGRNAARGARREARAKIRRCGGRRRRRDATDARTTDGCGIGEGRGGIGIDAENGGGGAKTRIGDETAEKGGAIEARITTGTIDVVVVTNGGTNEKRRGIAVVPTRGRVDSWTIEEEKTKAGAIGAGTGNTDEAGAIRGEGDVATEGASGKASHGTSRKADPAAAGTTTDGSENDRDAATADRVPPGIPIATQDAAESARETYHLLDPRRKRKGVVKERLRTINEMEIVAATAEEEPEVARKMEGEKAARGTGAVKMVTSFRCDHSHG